MTYKVLNGWRADLPTGTAFDPADYALSDLDVEFLVAAGRIQNVTTTQHEPAKLKPKKRKD